MPLPGSSQNLMSETDPLKAILADAAYAKNQLFCKSRIIAWSHRRRFLLARKLVEPFSGTGLIDYGAGDGSFLVLVKDLFPEAQGVDVNPNYVSDCKSLFKDIPGLKFSLLKDFKQATPNKKFRVVMCMEVLEHCLEEQLPQVLQDLADFSEPGGVVMISVPIETGFSLVVKETLRTVAGCLNQGDYRWKEKYSFVEFMKMIFAGEKGSIVRPVLRSDYAPGQPNFYHGHKGFNWRSLRRKISERFEIQETKFSPTSIGKGFMASQVWFICQVKHPTKR